MVLRLVGALVVTGAAIGVMPVIAGMSRLRPASMLAALGLSGVAVSILAMRHARARAREVES